MLPIMNGQHPPPQDKTPFALIDAWGLECFKLGFEMGSQLAQNE